MITDETGVAVAQTEETLPTVALSIRQPWAWLIVRGYKDCENRTWPTTFRGRFLVHAAKGMTVAEYVACSRWVKAVHCLHLPPFHDFDRERGGIVGEAELYDCRLYSDSEWHEPGQWGFMVRNARPLPFVPCPGRLNFFTLKI